VGGVAEGGSGGVEGVEGRKNKRRDVTSSSVVTISDVFCPHYRTFDAVQYSVVPL
jgi:hypothetical protein